MLKYGGLVVRFGLGGPRLNPFALPPTDENVEFIYRLIWLLLVKGGAILAPAEDHDLYERLKVMLVRDCAMIRAAVQKPKAR